MPEKNRPVVALLASPNTSPSVLYGLYDVLYTAGAVFCDMVLGEPGKELLDVRIVSASGEPFRCVGGVMVEPQSSLEDLGSVDAVVVCDMYLPVNADPRGSFADEADWLKQIHKRGSLVCSVCSGSLVVAEAGLLEGRQTAAHWAYDEMFRQFYPGVRMDRDSILCLAAEDDRIVTAGGVTSWQELALYLISRFCGPAQARETAKVHLIAGHEDGQLIFAAHNRSLTFTDAAVARSHKWITKNFARANPVQSMAEIAGLNIRTFSRRFKTASGHSPLEYVQLLRVDEARGMLENSVRSPEEIGMLVGYEDPTSFRRIFRKLAGLTPAAYRKKYQNIPQFR